MAKTMAIPTFDLSLAPPGKMRMPSIQGGGIDGGRTLSGVDNAIDMTGGGIITARYSDIELGNVDPARQRYWSRLGAILNSRVRSIIVPMMTDFIQPGGFTSTMASNAAVNATTITINLFGMVPVDNLLTGGEWLEISGPVRLNRIHCITDVQSYFVNPDGSAVFTVIITPPLREAAQTNQVVNFNRPKCLMRLAPGQQITSDLDSAYWTTPEVEFIESFGSV